MVQLSSNFAMLDWSPLILRYAMCVEAMSHSMNTQSSCDPRAKKCFRVVRTFSRPVGLALFTELRGIVNLSVVLDLNTQINPAA